MSMDPIVAAVTSRRSVRAYSSRPVDEQVIRDILMASARAPSGTNIQPWRVYVLTGTAQAALVERILRAFDQGKQEGLGDYYPTEVVEPYLSRRRKIGWDLYGLLGIEKGDYAASAAYHRQNFEFFGAPVGLIFTLHSTMQKGGWLDLGLFMSNVMTLARGYGLDTCPQAAWLEFATEVEDQIGIGEDEDLIVGMAMGYEDPDALINQLVTERASLDEFVSFL